MIFPEHSTVVLGRQFKQNCIKRQFLVRVHIIKTINIIIKYRAQYKFKIQYKRTDKIYTNMAYDLLRKNFPSASTLNSTSSPSFPICNDDIAYHDLVPYVLVPFLCTLVRISVT